MNSPRSRSPELLLANWEAPDNVVAFTTTRIGGLSSPPYESFNLADHCGDEFETVQNNRERLANCLEKGLSFQWLRQEHGVQVLHTSSCVGVPTADALVSNQAGIACCVLTADCLPVFLAEENGKEVCVIHAGWQGMSNGIIGEAIEKMHTDAKHLVAWLGPAIGPCHYEVGSDVRDRYTNNFGELLSESCFQSTAVDGKYMADLFSIANHILMSCGVNKISGGDHCTHCDQENFFSYRRDGVTGRMANIIYINH